MSNLSTTSPRPAQRYHVTGMSCTHCVQAITRAIQAGDAQAVVEVNLAAGLVEVHSQLSREQTIQLIQEEGYEITD